MEYLLAIGLAMFAGLFLSRLASKFNLPDVTSYLVAGVLIGPLCLGALGIPNLGLPSFDFVEKLGLISDVSLGFIAFSIGNEFRLEELRHIGRQATIIAIFQALSATIFVDVGLLILHLFLGDTLPVYTCIVLGAIATATAPAATVMVINQYKAKGPLTNILLPIVALDDAVGLIVFAVSTGIAKALISGSINLVSVIVNPLVEIVASLVLGAALGWVFSIVEKFFNSRSKRLSLAVAFVFLCTAFSKIELTFGNGVEIGFSSLLVCMMCGTIFCNLCDFSDEIMYRTDRWTAPVYVLFFVLSGAELDLRVFGSAAVVGIGLVYILMRSAGKIVGASVSSRMVGCPKTVCKPGHHPAAPGRCGSGYVRHRRRRLRCRGCHHAQHRPLLRADLRAGRPHPDQDCPDGFRRNLPQDHLQPRRPARGDSQERVISIKILRCEGSQRIIFMPSAHSPEYQSRGRISPAPYGRAGQYSRW